MTINIYSNLAGYWELLQSPPKGTTIHLVRAARSDRWSDADNKELESAVKQTQHNIDTGTLVLHELADAGHWLHVDNPQGLVQLMAQNMKDL